MFARHIVRIASLVVALGAVVAVAGVQRDRADASAATRPAPLSLASSTGPATRPPIGFSGGASSIDALLDDFLAAVERKDTAAMHRLRVTKDEYNAIIVPGTVGKGESPRAISDQPREFFWQINDRKSRYAADAIVNKFGGLHYIRRDLRFSKGTREYLWYTASGQVRLNLYTADDGPYELLTGTIAAVDGRYKFIAFQWND